MRASRYFQSGNELSLQNTAIFCNHFPSILTRFITTLFPLQKTTGRDHLKLQCDLMLMQQSKSYLRSQVGTPNKFSQRNTQLCMLNWQTQRQRQCFSPTTPVPGRSGRSTHKGCVPCEPSVGRDQPKDRLESPRKLGWNSDPALTNAGAQWRNVSAPLSENGDEMVSSRCRLQCGLNKTEGLVNIYLSLQYVPVTHEVLFK